MATKEEVIEARGRVDSLRDQIAEAKLSRQRVDNDLVNEMTLDSLAAEERRLAAELAALNGEDVAQETTPEGYVVPMGTTSIETDVIKVNAEDLPDQPAVTLPGETFEPAVVAVSEPAKADEKATTKATETKTTTSPKGA